MRFVASRRSPRACAHRGHAAGALCRRRLPRAAQRLGRRRSTPQAQHLVLDCGPLGEGNHGHFDALSFELAAHGRALVVDPGRYTYSEAGDVNWRVHFRGTAAHNTVCVDGRHQTRYAPKPIKEALAPRAGPVAPSHRRAGAGHHAAGSRLLAPAGPAARARRQQRVRGRARTRDRCSWTRRYWLLSDSLAQPRHAPLRDAAAAGRRRTGRHAPV
jgi:hypothetical protein